MEDFFDYFFQKPSDGDEPMDKMYKPPKYGYEDTDEEDDSILGSDIPDLAAIGDEITTPTGFLATWT